MEDVASIRAEMAERISSNTAHDRELEDALYQSRASASQASVGNPHIRASMGYAGALGGANSYMEMLVQRRDVQAAQRTPRSANSWSAENKRPGSWMSGVGNMTPIGSGRQFASGVGRPLIQQRDS